MDKIISYIVEISVRDKNGNVKQVFTTQYAARDKAAEEFDEACLNAIEKARREIILK